MKRHKVGQEEMAKVLLIEPLLMVRSRFSLSPLILFCKKCEIQNRLRIMHRVLHTNSVRHTRHKGLHPVFKLRVYLPYNEERQRQTQRDYFSPTLSEGEERGGTTEGCVALLHTV